MKRVSVIGLILFLLGAGTLSYSYGPIISQEIKYYLKTITPNSAEKALTGQVPSGAALEFETKTEPVDTEFGIMIPKIEANAPVVKNVDPFDAEIYQRKLAEGVAHAQGTGLPGQDKTMFLFAHASGDITMARRYNSIFYLLNKMEAGDEIKIYYQGAPYTYKVSEVKQVAPEDVEFLNDDPNTDLILMTCTPPGTTWRRLLVMANKE